MRKRIREYGIAMGNMGIGQFNSITDVARIRVGHTTLCTGDGRLMPGRGPVRTGVTAVLPHAGNLFKNKVPAACYVGNGFGKSAGLIQIEELGYIETPILLTNTLNVGLASDALIEYMIVQNPEIGITTGTVNPVVLECNDGYLNDIQGRHVKKEHVFSAIESAAGGPIETGDVGAGKGMSCFEFKGGIGTSSRITPEGYTVGVLALTNFGRREDLIIKGIPLCDILKDYPGNYVDDGSCIVIVATDAPLDPHGLKRLARRVPLGLARTGSYMSNGSGDIAVAFSTKNTIEHDPQTPVYTTEQINPNSGSMSSLFKAVVESTEEAVIDSLFTAETVVGRDGNVRYALPVEHILQYLA